MSLCYTSIEEQLQSNEQDIPYDFIFTFITVFPNKFRQMGIYGL